MYIEIDQISSKGLALNDSVALDESLLIEEESRFAEDITYDVRFSREGDKVKAKGAIRTMVSIPCSRCLEPFEMEVDSGFDIILFPIEFMEPGDSSLDSDEMEYIFFEGERIDLAKILMEQVNLFIPYRPVCGGDCKGLCPNCGTNLNNESCQCENSFPEANFLFDKI